MSNVRLYNYFRSSSAWRVRIGLNLKGIEYEYVAVSLLKDEHLTSSYGEVNPLHAVPTLEIDGLRLAESMAILEYLDETRPSPAFLPTSSAARAQVRRVAEVFNSGTQPQQNLRVLRRLETQFGASPDARKAWAAHFIAEGFAGVERLLTDTAGLCCFGDSVSLADLYLVPQMYGARRMGVDLAPFPKLVAIDQHLQTLDAFVRARPAAQPDAPADER